MTLEYAEGMMNVAAQEMRRKELMARATLVHGDVDMKRARLREWAVATRQFNRWRQVVADLEKHVNFA
jgi:hypothetical protein